jgi:hypothetical protein
MFVPVIPVNGVLKLQQRYINADTPAPGTESFGVS